MIETTRRSSASLGRRALLTSAVDVGALALLAAAVPRAAVAQVQGGGAATGAPQQSRPTTPGTRLVLLGTRGGPGIDLTRAQTASAVVVDGVPYLVDCGYGTVRQLVASNVGYLQVGTVFFTHLHDDHIGDFGALLSYQWTNSKATPTDAYGPYGTAKLVEAAIGFFEPNVEIRTVDEGRTAKPATMFHGHDIAASATPVQAFKDERITVTAIESAHYPPRSTAKMPHRALALRFDTKDRSIVFTGDTAYTANIVKLAHGADVLVSEIMDQAQHDQMERRGRDEAAAGRPDNIFRHVAETHSTPADVGRMAEEAGVKTVVLNHLLPGAVPPGGLAYPVTAFIDGVRKQFAGEVVVGQDLMVL
jgi:ribonuclease BN (tRNA processing enzyme)